MASEAEGVDGDGSGDDDLLLHLGGAPPFFSPFPFLFIFLSFWEAVVGFAGFR